MINGLRKYNFKATLFQEETKQKLMIDRFTRDSISKLCYKMIERDKNNNFEATLLHEAKINNQQITNRYVISKLYQNYTQRNEVKIND